MHLSALLIALALTSGANTPSQTAPAPTVLPDSPSATVQVDKQTGVHLYIPAGWHVRREAKADQVALFVSKEDIATHGGFLTGFSLNWNPRFSARTGLTPLQYAQSFAKEMHRTHAGTEVKALTLRPGVDVIEVRFTDGSRMPATLMTYLAVADTPGDTLQLAWFETPEALRDVEGPRGQHILSTFLQGVASPPAP